MKTVLKAEDSANMVIKKLVTAKWDQFYQDLIIFNSRNRKNKAPEHLEDLQYTAYLNDKSILSLEKHGKYYERSPCLESFASTAEKETLEERNEFLKDMLKI